MAHSFIVKLNHEISEILQEVASAITENGGLFNGNAECGIFHYNSAAGLIKGNYCSVSSSEIKITITDKPFFVPHGIIETEISKYFS